MRLPCVFALVLFYLGLIFSNAFAATPDGTPSLKHFDPAQVDSSLDPCADFFQYACRKWIKANPIPADQVGSGSFANLAIWNIAAVHDTLEVAARATKRSPAEHWMAPETKRIAHAKLSAQIEKIGYPDRWREYDFEIRRADFLGNAERSAKFEMEYRISKFGKPVNRYDWGMTAPTVNAYEDPQSNTINFPAGILQPPFFDAGASDAVNFGGVGSVISHESLRLPSASNLLPGSSNPCVTWWTATDSANYDERDACIQNEYTQEVPEAGVKQNGVLSAGEDTADNGGIHLSLNALRNELELDGKALDEAGGMTHLQLFFLSYANVWCGDLRPEAARTAVLTQGHSLSPYRVNKVVANMPEFAHAFGCHAGQPMVHLKACRVWQRVALTGGSGWLRELFCIRQCCCLCLSE